MSLQDHAIDDVFPADRVVPAPARLTEDEFVAWCDEETLAEWVDGDVIVMSPADVEHNRLRAWLEGVLGALAETGGLGTVVSETQVRLGKLRRRRTPDISFVAADRVSIIRKDHTEGPPDLIVEIVSPESEARDWREKYLEYQEAGVREYWVIDPMSEHAEAYVLAAAEAAQGAVKAPPQYRRIPEEQGAVHSAVLAGLRLPVAWLWKRNRPKLIEALRGLGLVA